MKPFWFVTTKQIALSDSSLKIEGNIPERSQYKIIVDIEDGKFTAAREESANYTVLSVIPFEDVVRVILEDNAQSSMYYIEIQSSELSFIEPYNVNWYHAFLAPEVKVGPAPNTMTSFEKNFETMTNIYGDEYVEKLSIKSA